MGICCCVPCESCGQVSCVCQEYKDNNRPGHQRVNNHINSNSPHQKKYENQTYQKQKMVPQHPQIVPKKKVENPLDDSLSIWKMKKKELDDQNVRLSNNISRAKDDLKRFQQERSKLLGDRDWAESHLQKNRKQMDERNKIFLQIKNKLQAAENQYRSLMAQKGSIQADNHKQRINLQQLQNRENQIQKLRDEYTKQLSLSESITKEIDDLKSQIKGIQDNIVSLTNKVNEKRAEMDVKEAQRNTFQKLIRQIQQKIKIKQKRYNELVQRRKIQINQIQKIANDISQKQKQKRQLSIPKPGVNSRSYSMYFAGDVLDGDDDIKQFIITFLEKRLKAKITSTKFVYRYDNLNTTNIHKYIDNKDNLVLIIRLENGSLLGAWNQGPFYSKMNSDRDGIIFSLTNRKVFEPLQRNKRAICYDDYFVIYGNSELRLKSQDRKLFSNFGISNGYYKNDGYKVDTLFGETEREVLLRSYQFFQLKFK